MIRHLDRFGAQGSLNFLQTDWDQPLPRARRYEHPRFTPVLPSGVVSSRRAAGSLLHCPKNLPQIEPNDASDLRPEDFSVRYARHTETALMPAPSRITTRVSFDGLLPVMLMTVLTIGYSPLLLTIPLDVCYGSLGL